ncbi:hypothetical protein DENSPDRAFT_790470 [Dentipellis sp. KUC8613]|nr:hypothetical protein DENSPDRAFT_790470 [Dentipellis sp. KUC8613]
MTTNTARGLAQRSVQANKELQYALKVYTERIEAELQTLNKLLSVAELDENEPQFETSGSVVVPGSKRPVGLISSADLMSETSPFYEDSMRRERYLNLTETHPMKARELDSLAEAVRMENYRLCAYDAQRRGLQPFHAAHENPRFLEMNTEGLDWERIAMNVSANSAAGDGRSAKECEIRWLGDRHPRFDHATWTQTEIDKVKTLTERVPEGEVDWVEVAKQLGTNRTPIDCMRHAIPRKTLSWDDESDIRLLDAVKIYGTENWSLGTLLVIISVNRLTDMLFVVARTVSEDATAIQCSNRYYRTLDPTLKRGSWSPEEDAKLRMAVDLYGHTWMEVASVIPGRTNEQCRDRWSERLNPSVAKGKWTSEEDKRLLAAVQEVLQNGDLRWKDVSEKLGTGRTDNMCRHRYDLLQKHQEKGSASVTPGSSVAPTPTPDEGGPSDAAPATQSSKAARKQTSPAANAQQTDSQARVPERGRPKPRPVARLRRNPAAVDADANSTPTTSTSNSAEPQAPAKPKPRPRPVKKASSVPSPPSSSVVSTEVASGTQNTPKAGNKGKAKATSSDKDTSATPKARAPRAPRKRLSQVEGEPEQTSVPAKKRNTVTRGKTRKKPAEESETRSVESEDEDHMDVDSAPPIASSSKRKRPTKAPAVPTRRQPRRSVNTQAPVASQDQEDVDMDH